MCTCGKLVTSWFGSRGSIDFRHLAWMSHTLSSRVFPSQRGIVSVRLRRHRLSAFCKTPHIMSSRPFNTGYDPLREKDILPSHQSREWERSGFEAQSPRRFSIPRITKEKSTAAFHRLESVSYLFVSVQFVEKPPEETTTFHFDRILSHSCRRKGRGVNYSAVAKSSLQAPTRVDQFLT